MEHLGSFPKNSFLMLVCGFGLTHLILSRVNDAFDILIKELAL